MIAGEFNYKNMSDRVRISSSLTYFVRFIMPWVWGILFVYLLYFQYTHGMWVNFFLIVVIGVLLMCWEWYWNMSIKEVFLDEKYLYVSDFAKEIKIHRSKIERVTQWHFNSGRHVCIFLSEKTEFGDKIMFIPTTIILSAFNVHPIVAELKKKIE